MGALGTLLRRAAARLHRAGGPPAEASGDGHPAVEPDRFVAPWFVAGDQYRVVMTQRLVGQIAPRLQSCLQVGLGRGWGSGFGPNWVVVDLYDHSPGVHYHYDVADLPADWTETFDLVLCNAVLEHVPNPVEAIAELHRVLRKGGLIWCEVPFAQPYHVAARSSDHAEYAIGGDYWRVSVQGMRVWMRAFEEIRCDWAGEGAVFFFGKKPD